MKAFTTILVVVMAVVTAEHELRNILRSPVATLRLYNNFKSARHLSFDSAEDRQRFRLFRRNAEQVASYNEDTDDNAVYVLNKFSTMTAEEKRSYLGFNATHTGTDRNPEDYRLGSRRNLPEKVLWTNNDHVTRAEDQGECGSCWTFGAVAGLETRYRIISGVLRKFSEQEYLDCAYEGEDDGCRGGTIYRCYSYSQKVGGRLASRSAYPYTQRDGRCLSRSKSDAMISARIRGNIYVPKSEEAHLEAVTHGSVAVAFEVTDRFHQYGKEIMKDTSCRKEVNHAVAMVGYTSKFILVKNSWGEDWGDMGFVRFVRNYHNCRMYMWSAYPRLDKTGKRDSGRSDPATTFRPREDDEYNPNPGPNPGPDPNCRDINSDCSKWQHNCKTNGWIDYMKKNCAKTCNYCSTDGGDCPSGTVRCPDNVCRHQHMC